MALLNGLTEASVRRPPRVVITGDPGTGKSTCAARAYKPVCLNLEDGMAGLDVPGFAASNIQEVDAALEQLLNGEHDFKTLIVDTLDKYESFTVNATTSAAGKEFLARFRWGQGTGEVFDRTYRLLEQLDELRAKRNMQIILICHAKKIKIDDPVVGTYETTGPALRAKDSVQAVISWADIVGHMTRSRRKINAAAASEQTGMSVSKMVPRMEDGEVGGRYISFESDGSFLAKSRFRTIPRESIAIDFDEGWSLIEKLMNQKEDEQQQKGAA